jgi:hypothetical protein
MSQKSPWILFLFCACPGASRPSHFALIRSWSTVLFIFTDVISKQIIIDFISVIHQRPTRPCTISRAIPLYIMFIMSIQRVI